jgi:hypothetical protein
MDGELHLVALADLQYTPDLVEAGYVAKEQDGRRNRYQIRAHLPLPEPDGAEHTIGEILALLVGSDTAAT